MKTIDKFRKFIKKNLRSWIEETKMVLSITLIVAITVVSARVLTERYFAPCQQLWYKYKTKVEPDRYSQCYDCKNYNSHKEMIEVTKKGLKNKVWICRWTHRQGVI